MQLGILLEVASFCVKNNITYFLSSGTLLGAVRHHGYIPWDDDIDVMMPRPDYERFAKEFHSDIYEFIDMNKDIDFPYILAKVIDNRTCLKEANWEYKRLGVHIDVFPLDGFPTTGLIRKWHKFILKCFVYLRTVKYVAIKEKTNKIKRICFYVFRFFLLLCSRRFLTNIVHSLQTKYTWVASDYVSNLGSINERLCAKKQWFVSTVLKSFEQYEFAVPVGYREWLHLIYGDFMQLPPEEKRIVGHSFEAWKK